MLNTTRLGDAQGNSPEAGGAIVILGFYFLYLACLLLLSYFIPKQRLFVELNGGEEWISNSLVSVSAHFVVSRSTAES